MIFITQHEKILFEELYTYKHARAAVVYIEWHVNLEAINELNNSLKTKESMENIPPYNVDEETAVIKTTLGL